MKAGIERDYAALPQQPFPDAPGIVSNRTTDTSRLAGKNPVKRGSQRRLVFRWFVENPGSCISDLEVAGVLSHGSVHGRTNELLGKNEKFNELHPVGALLRYSSDTKLTPSGKLAHIIEPTEIGRRVYSMQEAS